MVVLDTCADIFATAKKCLKQPKHCLFFGCDKNCVYFLDVHQLVVELYTKHILSADFDKTVKKSCLTQASRLQKTWLRSN